MTRRRKKHRPEEVVAKLRDADAMLNAGKDLAADVVRHTPANDQVAQAAPRRHRFESSRRGSCASAAAGYRPFPSQSLRRFGCRVGTFRPSCRQIRSTRFGSPTSLQTAEGP